MRVKLLQAYSPLRWTAITWVGVLFWFFQPMWINLLPPYFIYQVNQVTGEWERVSYQSISELPFPWGWPFHFHVPGSYLRDPTLPALAGTVQTNPPSEFYSWLLAINIVLILLATISLVYILQKKFINYSVKHLIVLAAGTIAFLTIPNLPGANLWYGSLRTIIYFAPIPLAIAAYFDRFPSLAWLKSLGITLSRRLTAAPEANAEDLLSQAAKLDRRGDWAEAIHLYENVARRWPEHLSYTQACIRSIQEKQTLSGV